jgi:hypothetical protein
MKKIDILKDLSGQSHDVLSARDGSTITAPAAADWSHKDTFTAPRDISSDILS